MSQPYYEPFNRNHDDLMEAIRELLPWQEREQAEDLGSDLMRMIEELVNAPEDSARLSTTAQLIVEAEAIWHGPDSNRQALLWSVLTERAEGGDHIAYEWIKEAGSRG